MIKSVLIIDDEKLQAESIAKAFQKERSEYLIEYAYEQADILKKIETFFFNVAVVDLRMDKFEINGIKIIKKIIEINPFAKIIVVSAYLTEFVSELTPILKTGKIQAIVEKKDFNVYVQEIFIKADEIVSDFDSNTLLNSKALTKIYATSKNEKDTYKKGKSFEDFAILLFASMGFKYIYNRIIDKSKNETDIAIRNDIADIFFQKFGHYILVECKNKPEGYIDKNDLIVFLSKVQHSNSLSNLGILITSGYIGKPTYLEAMRNSKGKEKIIFIDNVIIERILNSTDYLLELKFIIDSQVKDN